MKSDRYSRGILAAAGSVMLAAMTALGCSTMQSPDSLLEGAGLRINQLQVLGSRNSYSLGVDPQLMAMYAPRVGEVIDRRLAMVSAAARDQYRENHPNPGGISDGLGYAFPEGLIGQLDAGLRSLELDVNYDPDGGRFADPEGYRALAARGVAVSMGVPEKLMPQVIRSKTESTPPTVNHAPSVEIVKGALTRHFGADRIIAPPGQTRNPPRAHRPRRP